jgi:hypothetical protein
VVLFRAAAAHEIRVTLGSFVILPSGQKWEEQVDRKRWQLE